MATLAVAVVKANHNIMSNLTVSPVDAFRLVVSQAASLLKYYPGLKLLVAPEYFLHTRQPGRADVPVPVDRTAKHDTYRELKAISKSYPDMIIVAGTIFYTKKANAVGLNVCPILKSGKMIYKYYKKFDDGGLGKNFADAEYDSKPSSPIFTVGGIVFGVEVCGDMVDDAAAEKNWNGEDNSGRVQVHIVIADGGGINRRKIQAGAGGYVIHTNLAGGPISVMKSNSGQWTLNLANNFVRPDADVEPSGATTIQATGVKIEVFDLTV